MNAGIAGKLVGKFIEKQWPIDKEDIFEILRLGINKARTMGKWKGMTAEFDSTVYRDRSGQSYIMAPISHPVLLALNGLSVGLTLRDQYFMFHRNGFGDIRNSPGCNWNEDVYSIGEVPYFDRNNIIFSEGIRIGVRGLGPAGKNEVLNINGSYEGGGKVYTYSNKDFGTGCGCTSDQATVETIHGVNLNIGSDFNYINNVCFTSIASITKTITQSPVEIIAIDSKNVGHRIGRMEPNQRFLKYNKFLVPNNLCGRESLHGLFKIGEQEVITSLTDEIIISNEEALISLAKGIYAMYHKEQQEIGASFILQAISVLEKEKSEESSPTEFPVQVEGIYDGDIPEVLQYHH